MSFYKSPSWSSLPKATWKLTGVEPKDSLSFAWRNEEKVSEVFGEDLDGGFLGGAVQVGTDTSNDERMDWNEEITLIGYIVDFLLHNDFMNEIVLSKMHSAHIGASWRVDNTMKDYFNYSFY